jgi:hypothetical protein
VKTVVAVVGGVAAAGAVAIAAAIRRYRQQQGDIFDPMPRQSIIDDYVNSNRLRREILIQSSMEEDDDGGEEGRHLRQYVVGGCSCSSDRFDNQVPIVYLSSATTNTVRIDLSTTYYLTNYYTGTGSSTCSTQCPSIYSPCGTRCVSITTLTATF